MQDPERYRWFSLAVSLGPHGIIGCWDHGISPVCSCQVRRFWSGDIERDPLWPVTPSHRPSSLPRLPPQSKALE